MTASSSAITVKKIAGNSANSVADHVAVEEPLEIRLGYLTPAGRTAKSVSITMRTPGSDFELAAGFLFSESIVENHSDIENMEHCGPAAPDTGTHNIVRVDLASHIEVDLGRRPGARVAAVTIAGQPLEPGRLYRLATNDFLARGGDGYSPLRNAETIIDARDGDLIVNLVANYLKGTPRIAPRADGRIKAL